MIGGRPTVVGGYECYKTCIQVVLRISFKLEWQTTIFKYTHYTVEETMLTQYFFCIILWSRSVTSG